MLLKKQANVSPKRGLPAELTGLAKKVIDVTGETVPLFYFNAGVLTADAGQAAGVVVVGKFAYSNILNSNGMKVGSYNDNSLSFTCDALDSEVDSVEGSFEANDYNTLEDMAKKLTAGFADGRFIVDYATGTVFGKKKTATTDITAGAYKVASLLITATV